MQSGELCVQEDCIHETEAYVDADLIASKDVDCLPIQPPRHRRMPELDSPSHLRGPLYSCRAYRCLQHTLGYALKKIHSRIQSDHRGCGFQTSVSQRVNKAPWALWVGCKTRWAQSSPVGVAVWVGNIVALLVDTAGVNDACYHGLVGKLGSIPAWVSCTCALGRSRQASIHKDVPLQREGVRNKLKTCWKYAALGLIWWLRMWVIHGRNDRDLTMYSMFTTD